MTSEVYAMHGIIHAMWEESGKYNVVIEVGNFRYQALASYGFWRVYSEKWAEQTLDFLFLSEQIAIAEPEWFLVYQYRRGDNNDMLFLFAAAAEKAAFELLLGVSGLGPNYAIRIVSNVAHHILDEDWDALETKLLAAKGIGSKIAEKIMKQAKKGLE